MVNGFISKLIKFASVGVFVLGLNPIDAAEISLFDGVNAHEKGDYSRAFQILITYAENGDSEAQFRIGRMFHHGHGIDQSTEKAVSWYEKSARKGNYKAATNLGVIFEDTNLNTPNDEMAFKWYIEASKLGASKAQLYLAENALRLAKERNSDTILLSAYEWFSIAGDHGEKIGKDFRSRFEKKASKGTLSLLQRQVAAKYLDGKLVPRNVWRAELWMKDYPADNLISRRLMEKITSELQWFSSDSSKAVYRYVRGCSEGRSWDCETAINFYQNGVGVEVDKKTASMLQAQMCIEKPQWNNC